MSYKDPIIFLNDDEDEPAKVLLSDFQELEKFKVSSEHDGFLCDALKALNWQGGTRRQVLRVLSAARDVNCESKTAELTGDYEKLPLLLDALEYAFNT